MRKPFYNAEMQSSYQRLFDTCTITADKYSLVDGIVKSILRNQERYESVGSNLNIPWYFIGIIHSLECAGKFNSHLHNGDPLTARTVQVPAGRPKTGSPPFTWETSAEDALTLQKLHMWPDWTVPGMLFKFEEYNGFGYRRLVPVVNSPYLWSFSNHYTSGKYVKDGVFSKTAVSKQCGAAVLLRRLSELQVGSFSNMDRLSSLLKLAENTKYAPRKYSSGAEELQRLLNLSGYHVKVDGYAGKITSGAVFQLTGNYLNGDPRNKV